MMTPDPVCLRLKRRSSKLRWARNIQAHTPVHWLSIRSARPTLMVMPPDAGLVSRVADALEALGERAVRQKNVFGGRGFLVGKTTFAIVWDDALIVKTASSEYARLREEPGVTPFAPGGERPMSTWLVVDADTIADDPELTEWLRQALRGIRP